MSQEHVLYLSLAWRTIGRLEAAQIQLIVLQTLRVSQSVISRLGRRFLETGSVDRRSEQDDMSATTQNEDSYVTLMNKRNRTMNTTLL
ncbi:hypothetical protein NPIL_8801 [Nephila pilipes]|uniref:Uncharacterized protein n=1 Tax=Nephila pilipes TaxID=299642 RepID=A0A8X6TLM0_NEPPI|nr:hypothetical protein NPIL_8801 [Nephila pilipes]